jgi:hypothetical protein
VAEIRAPAHTPLAGSRLADVGGGDRVFKSIAGDRDPPKKRVKELWIIAGRRAGKDSAASLISTYAAIFFQTGIHKLRFGEKAVVQLLACDRDQSKIVLGYIRSFFDLIPPLRGMVTRRTATGLELMNDVCIKVGTNSYRAVRGRHPRERSGRGRLLRGRELRAARRRDLQRRAARDGDVARLDAGRHQLAASQERAALRQVQETLRRR